MDRALFASFGDAAQAEKAVGALLDHGARKEDVSIVVTDPKNDQSWANAAELDHSAKTGISTTTPEDTGAGASAGAGIGLGVGLLAGLASLFVPGVGLVLGGGALVAAIGAAVGTAAAGAVAGGVTGYLKDMGVPHDAVEAYSGKGAIIAVVVPSGSVTEIAGREIMTKYGGANVNVYEANVELLEANL